MSEPQAPGGSTIVVCEKHRLRYNSATHSGCARCRKESGEALTGAVPVPTGAARPSRPSAGRPASMSAPAMGTALAVTVLLVVAAGAGLFYAHTVAHRGLLATWGEVLGAMSGDEDEAPTVDPSTFGAEGSEDEAYPDDDEGEGSE